MYWGDDSAYGPRTTPPRIATKLITPPAVEPFTTAEAKLHCKIEIDDDNPNLSKWIRAARMKVENDTQRALLPQTWDAFVDGFPYWRAWLSLPFPPLQSVTSVNSTDTAGVETVWNATNYIVDASSTPGRIALTDTGAWPTSLRLFQSGRIRYVAGYATPAAIPADLLMAMALLIGWFSENREPSAFDVSMYEALIQNYTVFSAA